MRDEPVRCEVRLTVEQQSWDHEVCETRPVAETEKPEENGGDIRHDI